MFGLSLGHLVILLVIVLLFRAGKLPEIGRGLGRTITAFKRGLKGEDLPTNAPTQERLGVREADEILPPKRGKS